MKRFRGWFEIDGMPVRWRLHPIYGPYMEDVIHRKVGEVIGGSAWTEAPKIRYVGHFSNWDACMAAIEEDLSA